MAHPILQTEVPHGVPWRFAPANRLPGLSPLPIEDWVLRDTVFAAQMAERDRLIASHKAQVLACQPGAIPAAQECLEMLVQALDDGYKVHPSHVVRPDGATVDRDDDPMATIGRLIQSDTCLLEAGPDGYVLTAAALCFPASWRLAEKIGKPLTAIHTPVPEYDDTLARRVQRVFDAIRPDNVLTRSNVILYDTPDLFAPRSEDDIKSRRDPKYVRTERQTLRRLPESNAVVFGIHTTVLALADLSPADRKAVLKVAKDP